MNNLAYLEEIVRRKTEPHPPGVFSVCSSNPFVLTAALQSIKAHGFPLLVETTCNQVNQYGGYTGLTPQAFACYVQDLALENSVPPQMILLGGDHLGTFAWKDEQAKSAMLKACELTRACIRAGYQKIHLDASAPCRDDPLPLPHEVIAKREAQLCRAAMDEIAVLERDLASLVFVLGSETPPAGGALRDKEGIMLSSVEETEENIQFTHKVFIENGLESAWERTIAFVVQPGVEFSDTQVHAFDLEQARGLSQLISTYPGLVYEAHSTDYQSRQALRQLVTGQFAILKVGPALTFALREALFALCDIESELFGGSGALLSNLKNVLEQVMLAEPQHWKRYYSGNSRTQAFQLKYSLLDRSRYYLSTAQVEKAVVLLIQNLSHKAIPWPLISQYLPDQARKIVEGTIGSQPRDLIRGKITDIIEDYLFACRG